MFSIAATRANAPVLLILVQTQDCRVAQSVGKARMSIPVCMNLALTYMDKPVSDASGPDITIMVSMKALDGMGRE